MDDFYSAVDTFDGWATIKVADLTNKWSHTPQWEIHPSPEDPVGEDELTENIYHAHAACTEIRNDKGTALFLRHLFERYGDFEAIPASENRSILSWTGIVGMLQSFSRRFRLS